MTQTETASIKPPIKTAMVLAAGRGTRMRAADTDPPKPLTLLAGATLLDRMIEKLKSAGIERLVVNVHFKADWIEAHLLQNGARQDGLEVFISDERGHLMDTGGGVLKARETLGDAPFYVCNADVFWLETQNNLQALAQGFDPENMSALLLLADRARASGYDGAGDFHMSENGLLKRRGLDVQASLIYAGAQIVNPALLAEAPREGEPFSFNLLWDAAIAQNRLFGLPLQGDWMHIGTPEGLAEAEQRLQAG